MHFMTGIALVLIVSGCKAGDVKTQKIVDASGHEWPECIPENRQTVGMYWTSIGVFGPTQYCCSDEGRWQVDQAATDVELMREREEAQFINAIGTRKLSHEELQRLTPTINVLPYVVYFACEKYADLYDQLLNQWELQTGTKLPIKTHLSRKLGEYNRCPQEDDNRRAVEDLIEKLKRL